MKVAKAIVMLSVISVLPSAADQANIINNGGFESGLLCYQNWIWSQTGIDFQGDYKFSLSGDAHSGERSLEISCMGTDCLRAAIFSNRIPTPLDQGYRLSMYSKCPANTHSFIY